MDNKYRILTVFLLLFFTISIYSKLIAQENQEKNDYLAFKTGILGDNYNSYGIRLNFEYTKEIIGNRQYSISYETRRNVGHVLSGYQHDKPSNTNIITINYYYKIKLIKDKLYWNCGGGVGAAHVFWDNNNFFGVVFSLNASLNIKIFKKTYIETAPILFLLNPSKVYFVVGKFEDINNYIAFTILPIGIKVKL